MNYLLLICILLPLASGAFVFCLKNKTAKFQKAFCFASACITSAIVLSVILFGKDCSQITLVNFTENISFAFKTDGIGIFFAGMVAFLWPFAFIYAFEYMKHDKGHTYKYYGFYLMTYGVVLGVAFSANAITLYVFYELLTFITLPLIVHSETKEARKAGRLYLYYSLSGSSMALAGIVIMIVTTGSCSFIYGGTKALDSGLAVLAYALTFVGFGVKSAIFPLCRWLPMASAAPTPTTALLHAVAVVKSGAFAIIRMTFFMMPTEILRGSWAQYMAIGLGALTVVYGSCMSVKEQHLKRRFAYSTVSNLSYILLGVLMMTETGLTASLIHFLVHSITKIGIFFCIGAIIETMGTTYVYQLNGLGKKAPLIFTCFTISGLSLIGIPPFSGFVSKYYLIASFLSEGTVCGYIATGAIIISAVLTAYYVLSISFRAFVRNPNELSQTFFENCKEPTTTFIAVTGVFALLSLLIGLFGQVITNMIGGLI